LAIYSAGILKSNVVLQIGARTMQSIFGNVFYTNNFISNKHI